ncbi:hypothetical protein HMPREF9075_01525 [Capnocytophaga sp. oral taxon 332 str. F0381]|nr:hypothetical protein HMPREF9075_01525 [Capnocytophaga sp. oral taxon 332 str. F0381]
MLYNKIIYKFIKRANVQKKTIQNTIFVKKDFLSQKRKPFSMHII